MKVQELRRTYRETDRDLALFYYQLGKVTEESRTIRDMFIPNEDNMKSARGTLDGLKKRVHGLPAPDPVFTLVKHHFEDFLDSLDYTLRDTEEHPEKPYLNLDGLLQGMARCSRQPDEDRLEELLHRFRQLAENRDEILRLIRARHTESQRTAISSALLRTGAALEADQQRLRDYFPSFSEEKQARLLSALREICLLEQMMAAAVMTDRTAESTTDTAGSADPSAATVMPEGPAESADRGEDLSLHVKMEPEAYRTLLSKKLGVSLDELLEWNREEIEKTRREALEIGKKLPIREPAPTNMREVADILNRYAGPCETAEEMFARANEYLKRTRALAHEYVNLPEDEICVCVPIGESCRDSYPWGGYEGGDFRVKPFRGQMFLNQYNVPAITDGWIKMNCLHEAYPGHHCQYVRAAVDETPETVKIGAKLVPLLEGTCLRTERAFESLYGEDPFFPLFVAYRRHHASVRICVDLMMYYTGVPLRDVISLYQEELGFDFETARKQVRAHQNSPGYFTCYYYGMKKLAEWETSSGLSKKEFTELLFSAGYISIDRFGELLRLTPEERERYFHEFSSLLRE